MRMDFEIIPTSESLGRKFAYDLSRQEFQALSQKRKSWTHLLYKDPETGKKTKPVPYLSRGAEID